jgi:RHS repeat-associated protein
MSISSRETILSQYLYDPLDRQRGCTLSQQPAIQRFYCESRLATELQGEARWSIVQHEDHLLAQRKLQNGKLDIALLATDQQRSVLNALDATHPRPLAYSPYGHRPAENVLLSLLGFNGERPDPVTGHHHLGNGYRQFNPVLMRFNSPDSWSPFGKGGLNAYGYCEGDPVGRSDPTGHFSFLRALLPATKSVLNFVKPTMFKASAISAVAGAAGLVVEANVELDETSNNVLLYGSSFLLGLGLGGMYRFRPSGPTGPNLAPSRRALPAPTRGTPNPNPPRSGSLDDLSFKMFEPSVPPTNRPGPWQPEQIRFPRANVPKAK